MIAAECNLAGPILLGVIGLALAGYAFVSSWRVNREARRELELGRRIRHNELLRWAQENHQHYRPGGPSQHDPQ